MIYRSNLTAPDLYPAFEPRVISKPRHNSLGHDVISDPEREPECGFLTHDEAAILYNIASGLSTEWLVIGGAVGWSAAHIVASGSIVKVLDPIYKDRRLYDRLVENMRFWRVNAANPLWYPIPITSEEYFNKFRTGEYIRQPHYPGGPLKGFGGALIDGDHTAPEPLNDTKNVFEHLEPYGKVVFHDVIGGPVQEAIVWLMDQGFKTKIYWTPHVMAVCWKDEFYEPPMHIHDLNIEKNLRPQMSNFPFDRCAQGVVLV